jgi:hypothetical protein
MDEDERNGGQLEFNWFDYSLGRVAVRVAWPGRVELEADPDVGRAAAVVMSVMDDYWCTKV